MSILHHPEAVNAPGLQVWNNAAFDDGDADESASIEPSWCPPQPIFGDGCETIDFDSSKENQSPVLCKSPVSAKSSISKKPLCHNFTVGNSQGKPLKLLFKQGLLPISPTASKTEKEITRSDDKIDAEIEEIEIEISRLSSKLESLRLEKADKNLKMNEKHGRIVPAKFMDQKQNHKNLALEKKIEESSTLTERSKFRKRGLSLGPSEIIAGTRPRQTRKPEITPIQSVRNRRVSCFWKISEIDELKVTKERGGALSVSPKPSRIFPKIQASKQALTTAGAKKPVKRDNSVISCVQPKKLFKDVKESVSAKKPIKNGRVVASRYNQIPPQSAGNQTATDQRKRSLPENDKVDARKCDKKRASSVGKVCGPLQASGRNQVTENQVKKQWRVPSETIVVHNGPMGTSPSSLLKMADLLPKIKTAPCMTDSPRDSGSAKRVSELIGRRSYFGTQKREVETSVCQALGFDEEEE